MMNFAALIDEVDPHAPEFQERLTTLLSAVYEHGISAGLERAGRTGNDRVDLVTILVKSRRVAFDISLHSLARLASAEGFCEDLPRLAGSGCERLWAARVDRLMTEGAVTVRVGGIERAWMVERSHPNAPVKGFWISPIVFRRRFV